MFTLSLPVLNLGNKINCNQETALFAEDRLIPVWNLINMLLDNPSHSETELKFINRWLTDGFLSDEIQKSIISNKCQVSGGIVAREFKKVLLAQRNLLRESSWRATLYKHLFATALHSDRDLKLLVTMLVTAREVLEIDSLTSALISDALLTAIPEIPFNINKIKSDEKEIIIALNFIALNADNQKHVSEIEACRTAMTTLSIVSINNTVLGALTQKTIPDLLKLLSTDSIPTAFLYILRMVVADGRIQSDEINLIREASSVLPKNLVKFLQIVSMLESGKVFAFI
jgi:hypothetical protein